MVERALMAHPHISNTRSAGRAIGLWLALAAATTAAAYGYDETIHALLDRRAYDPGFSASEVALPTIAAADALRALVWEAGSTHPDPEVQLGFRARYPTLAQFDGWAFKELLGLNPDRPVVGLDQLPALPPRPTIGTLLALGSRLPDDDGRNQDRFAHDARRHVRIGPYGDPLPADPLQLTFGPLRGIASQAYAHYGLPKVVLSDDPEVLRRDPRRFGYPPWIRAYGPQFAQLHTDLAVCAAGLGTPEGLALGWLLAGNAHHYIQDAANQIHTLQGIYRFFIDAKTESWKEQLLSLGGVVRARRGFVEIAIGIIRNHHHLTEQLFAKRVRERVGELPRHTGPLAAVVAITEDPTAAIGRGDPRLERELDRELGLASATDSGGADGRFGQIIAEMLVEASSHEGAAVYEAIHALAHPRYSRAGVTFDLKDDPDEALRPDVDPQTLARFYRLQTTGFARAGSALRRHVKLYRATLATLRMDATTRQQVALRAARRLVATQFAWKMASEGRLASYTPPPPLRQTVDLWIPAALAGLILTGAVARNALRRRRHHQEPRPI
jgi:hypothetical protein